MKRTVAFMAIAGLVVGALASVAVMAIGRVTAGSASKPSWSTACRRGPSQAIAAWA